MMILERFLRGLNDAIERFQSYPAYLRVGFIFLLGVITGMAVK